MNNKKKNGIIIGVFLGIIIILVVFIILMLSGVLDLKDKSNTDTNGDNINSGDTGSSVVTKIDYNSKYLEFINNMKYDMDGIYSEYTEKAYSVYDLNNDGVDELLLRFDTTLEDASSEWEYISIYTYNNDEIELVKTIYVWGELKYNTDTNEIVYTETKTSSLGNGTNGNILNYYKVNNSGLSLTWSISYTFDFNTNIYTYTKKDLTGNEIVLSDSEYKDINDKEITFDYNTIS